MSKNSIESWEEYWNKYDKLIAELNNENKLQLAEKLVNAKNFVNGLTDGWFEFKNELQNIIQQNESEFNEHYLIKAKYLLENIKVTLKN